MQLGEAPEHVFNVGAINIENIASLPRMTRKELQENLKSPPEAHSFSVVTLHPVTMEDHTVESQLYELIYATDAFYMLAVPPFWGRKDLEYGPDCYAYIMPKGRSIDIDEPIDFLIAEVLMQNQDIFETSLVKQTKQRKFFCLNHRGHAFLNHSPSEWFFI